MLADSFLPTLAGLGESAENGSGLAIDGQACATSLRIWPKFASIIQHLAKHKLAEVGLAEPWVDGIAAVHGVAHGGLQQQGHAGSTTVTRPSGLR